MDPFYTKIISPDFSAIFILGGGRQAMDVSDNLYRSKYNSNS